MLSKQIRSQCYDYVKKFAKLWHGGVAYIVVIASASGTKDSGFESRQGVRFLGLYTLQCIAIVHVREK
jgi:hypothetical protein